MDKIQKLLSEISAKERQNLIAVMELIASGNVEALDIKKLQGRKDVYRVRKGKFRLFLLRTGNDWRVISIERRSDTTYS